MVKYIDRGLMNIGRQLLEQNLVPVVRLYRISPDGSKMKALENIPFDQFDNHVVGDDIEECLLYAYGTGHYCVKLFSTRYGRNILEARHDCSVDDE